MKFDWTISVGQMLTLLSILGGMVIGYVNLIRRIDRIETKVDLMYDWFSENILGIRRTHVSDRTAR